MKRVISVLMLAVLLSVLAVPAMAAEEPVIIRQPQNPTYIEYGIASYSVTASGENLRCTWYLHFNGDDYNISNTGGGMQPWEYYAGETYGPDKSTNGDFTTFTYTFRGIGIEMDGCYIYAVIEDGHFDVTSDKAYISIAEDCGTAPEISVPVAMDVCKGDVLDLYCQATAPDGSRLSYLWYETGTGDLRDIVALNKGAENKDSLRVDTGAYGTRYYVCAVTTSQGGSAYSSVIPVTVMESQPTEQPVITTEALPEVVVDTAYDFQIGCTDENAQFSIHYNPGKANDFESTGLTLTEDGRLYGTPTLLGRFVFTVCASNGAGEAYKTFILDVIEDHSYIEILEVPTKLEYFSGETLDLTGLKVRVHNQDGTYFDSENGEGLTITDQPLVTLGEQKIKVAYGEDMDIFIVTVKEAPKDDPTVDPGQTDDPTADPGETNQPETPDDSDENDTKPVETPDSTKPAKADTDKEASAGMPWWGIVLIAVAAAGAGIGITIVILKKK